MAQTLDLERTATPAAMARRRLADREGPLSVLMLLPSVVYIIVLVAVPFFMALAFSFTDVTVGDPTFDWVGLNNYIAIFSDPVFWTSLRNTLVFTAISMVLIVVFSKILANILIANFRGKWIIRFVILLPWTTPVALSAVAWMWLLDSTFSPIDWALREMGLIESHLFYLGRPNLAMASLIAVYTWRMLPLAAVIVMAGLVAIPSDILEAAEVDGAGFWRRMFEVTVPLVLPVIAIAVLFGAVITFTDMTVAYIMTGGGPVHATEVLASWAFLRGVQGGDLGQGAAIALFLLPPLLAGVIAILTAVRRMEVS